MPCFSQGAVSAPAADSGTMVVAAGSGVGDDDSRGSGEGSMALPSPDGAKTASRRAWSGKLDAAADEAMQDLAVAAVSPASAREGAARAAKRAQSMAETGVDLMQEEAEAKLLGARDALVQRAKSAVEQGVQRASDAIGQRVLRGASDAVGQQVQRVQGALEQRVQGAKDAVVQEVQGARDAAERKLGEARVALEQQARGAIGAVVQHIEDADTRQAVREVQAAAQLHAPGLHTPGR